MASVGRTIGAALQQESSWRDQAAESVIATIVRAASAGAVR